LNSFLKNYLIDFIFIVVKEEIFTQSSSIMNATGNIYMEPSPLLSLMMDGCIEKGRDISLGGVYNNYGIHGTGLSTAVDSLAAVRKYVFEEKNSPKKNSSIFLRKTGRIMTRHSTFCATRRPRWGAIK
jgi:formate C-acetyltransferase